VVHLPSVTVTPVWPPFDGKADSRVRVVVVDVVEHLPSVTVTPVWPPLDGKSDSRVRVVVTSVRLYLDISSDDYPYIFVLVVSCICCK